MRVKSGEKGSITLIVFGIVTFILIILATTFTTLINKHKSQAIELQDLKDIYGMEGEDKIKSVYEEVAFEKGLLNGNGTEEDPYQIWTIEDLVKFSNRTNAGEKFTGKYVELMANLDFNENASYENPARTDYGDINGNNVVEQLKTELTTGKGFPCISATSDNAFDGYLEGNSKEIRNIYISVTSGAATRAGFFGYLGDSTINSLGITGSIITSNLSTLGGIAGAVLVNSTCNIDSCINKADISSNGASNSTGGIVGNVYGILNVTNSYNEGSISGSNNSGGIVGFTNNKINLTNCFNQGEITNGYGNNAGGLIGRDNEASNTITITNSYNTGNVTGKTSVGGLVGTTSGTLTITQSYNNGDVTSTIENVSNAINIGGIAGTNNANGNVTIANCHNTGNITSNATYSSSIINNGGILGRIYNGKIENCYNSGEIKGGNRLGGILGISFGSSSKTGNAKIINSYNIGEINSSQLTNENVSESDWNGRAGGIVDFAWQSKLDIINCYNNGKVSAYYAGGGILGQSQYGVVNLLNSYNKGDVSGINAAGGIGYIAKENTVKVNNIYNTGSLLGSNKAGEIINIDSDGTKIVTVSNCYFLGNTNLGIDGTSEGLTATNVISMTEAEMKNSNFVTTLNNNKNSINLLDYSLGDYSLLSWKAVANSYPEFNN